MKPDRSPVVLNILLALVLGFALYLGLLYMEHQQGLSEEVSKARQSRNEKNPTTDLPKVPAPAREPQEIPLPQAPLFIKDDIAKLINSDGAIKSMMKGYKSIGLNLGNESFTIFLNEDGSLKDVSKGIASQVDFTMKTTPGAFSRITLLAKHGNLLGLVERFNEMDFSPSGAKQEFINKLHSVQGFTSKMRNP